MVLSFLKVNIQTSTEGALNRECSSLQSISGHSRPVYSACIAGFGIDTAIAVRPQVQKVLCGNINPQFGKSYFACRLPRQVVTQSDITQRDKSGILNLIVGQ